MRHRDRYHVYYRATLSLFEDRDTISFLTDNVFLLLSKVFQQGASRLTAN